MATKTKKVSKKGSKASKAKTTKAPKVEAPKKVKVEYVVPHDFNKDNQVGSNGTPTKIWAQFPCNATNQGRIDTYMREKGIKTYAHLAQVLIAQALGLK